MPNTEDHVEEKVTRWDFALPSMDEDTKAHIVCTAPKDAKGLCATAIEWSATADGMIGSTSRNGDCPKCKAEGLYKDA